MASLPTLPHRSWTERVTLTLEAALVLIAAVTLTGWFLHVDELLVPISGHAALKVNAALGFCSIGVALLAVEFGRPAWASVAGLAVLIGGATLAQDLFGFNAHIDELVAADHLLTRTEHPGRMASTVAVCLVLAGGVLLWRVIPWSPRARPYGEAVAGSIVASAGVATLFGYAADLYEIYTWGSGTATSPAGSASLILAGSALVGLSWREHLKAHGEAPAWSPLPFIIGCLTLTGILWLALRTREHAVLNANTRSQMDQFAVEIQGMLERQANDLERMLARPWGDKPQNDFDAWDADANDLMTGVRRGGTGSGQLGCLSIAFVLPSLRTDWVFPRANNEAARGFSHGAQPERNAAIAQAAKGPVISGSLPVLVPGGGLVKGFVIYTPVIRGGTTIGYLAAEYAYETFLHHLARHRDFFGTFEIDVAVGGERIYFRKANDGTRHERLTTAKTYPIADRRFQIGLTPSDAALAKNRHYLPELALAAGFGISVLLGLSVHLARSARAGQRAAELSNKKLFGENEERRRVEARLKISDDRLRLALDSTQIGIFEWSVAAGHVYYSPGLWAMLGYEHTRMPSTVEAWQSLIHPEDLPVYRRRTESQLNGIASFIEPEYRVRARSGDWRWVYTRSKTVASNPDGRPTRIVGTVQDITARREAELALRESQAEARKLSLVAAKTDNPVLIGSPDGRIEWANEAFCRMMEYSLEEVIGKTPAQFMVGPDTNPRALARIRAAIARGHGITTDVVNYSKSGRRYYLHIEIQPVRGASGEVENYITVGTDITTRVETEQQLRRAKAEADDASRAKSDFLASMSHEIRTPMNGVIGMTSLLMETTLTTEQRDYVSTIRTSGEALLTIINDILDFSKIESGKMELERAPFELALCIEEALDLFSLQASAKRLEIGYHIAPEVPAWLMGDVTRLRQILVNLVNNAVKFTPSGSVSIEVRRAMREPVPPGFDPGVPTDAARTILEFTVHDTGIGIPPERLDRLFKAFSQVDSSTTRKYGGTGLGLAICQRLCELMGGGIRVSSTIGQGSTFTFTIQTEAATTDTEPGLLPAPAPLQDAPALCIEDHPVTQARLRTMFEKWGVECTVVPNTGEALQAAAARPPALLVLDAGEFDVPGAEATLGRISCPRMLLYPFGQTAPTGLADGQPFAWTSKPIRTTTFLHTVVNLFQSSALGLAPSGRAADPTVADEIPLEVLLAEDNAVNQKVALRFLERLGYRADAVANGLEAVTTLENRRYDLVLMDLQMPEMDGFEATRQIRARLPADRQPKIVALTANAMQGDRELCVAAGMDDYITKPVKMHEIAAAIRRHFGKPDPVPDGERLIG